MKFREQRGSYVESMATAVDLADRAALVEHLANILPLIIAPAVIDQGLSVKPYGGIDPRNGWDTYIVSLPKMGVLGFTDGPSDNGNGDV